MGGNGRGAARHVALAVADADHGLADDLVGEMRQLQLRGDESMEAGPYPERPGEPNCAFFMRSGSCKFGKTCKFNHPPDRHLVAATARLKGEYPERIGQPECQYYIKTGTCKFGATCKFHHPKDAIDTASRVQLNMLGYPLRPNEVECSYYLRTGQCKFGNTCKFHHRQPASLMLSAHGSPIHPSVHSPSTHPYQGGLTNWPITRSTFFPGPKSVHTTAMHPQGSGHQLGWDSPSGVLHSFSSPTNLKEMPNSGNFQQGKASAGHQGVFTPYDTSAIPIDMYSLQRESMFPERPGEPECQFYMKTGDCKFGSVCRFHHPRERSISAPDCMLSPLGLPLRPGEPLCVFYSRYGICKFGPNCKFDHPVQSSVNGSLTSASPDVSFNTDLLGSPIAGAGQSRQLSQTQHLTSDEHTDVE